MKKRSGVSNQTDDRQIFLNQQTEQSTTTPSKAPDLFLEFRRGTTNHTPIYDPSPFSFLLFLFFSSRRQTIVPRAFHPVKKPPPYQARTKPRHLTCKLTTRNQTGNQPNPGTSLHLPPSASVCNATLMPSPANGASKKRCRVQWVEGRKEGRECVHEVGFVG